METLTKRQRPLMSGGKFIPVNVLPLAFWLIVAGVWVPSVEAQTVALRYQFKAGESIKYSLTQKMKVNMILGERNAASQVDQVMEMTWKINSVDAAGKATITQTIDRIRAVLDSAMGKVTIDTQDPAAPKDNTVADVYNLYKNMIKVSFTQDMDAQGNISNIQIPDAVLQQLKQTAPAMAGPGGMLSAEGLKSMAEQSSLPFPKEPVAPKATWDKTIDIPMPMVGVVKVKNTYMFAGPQAGLDLIQVKGAMTLSVDPVLAEKVKVELKVKKFEGYAQFDSRAGKMQKFELAQNFSLTSSEAGQSLVQDIAQTTTFELLGPKPPKS